MLENFAPQTKRAPDDKPIRMKGTSAISMETHSYYPESLFHQHWWLDAVTRGTFGEVTVSSGTEIVARLPYFTIKRLGFTQLRMPPLTHVLGPVISISSGKPQTRLLRRLSIVRDLVERLPKHDFFNQTLSEADIDVLAFQDLGFQASLQYTFEIDCRSDTEALWSAMHFKTRQHIRRAEEKFVVGSIDDPREFVRFYNQNLRERQRRSYFPIDVFPEVFIKCRENDCCEILNAKWPNGKTAAMIVLVWDRQKMYYLLSTHARAEGDNGSVNLLIWAAINRAHARGLMFDLDGVTTSGTARFLSGFGGAPKLRAVVKRSKFAFGLIQETREKFGRYYFT